MFIIAQETETRPLLLQVYSVFPEAQLKSLLRPTVRICSQPRYSSALYLSPTHPLSIALLVRVLML